MRVNRVKQRLASGGASLGAFFFEFATTGVGRLAAAAGADFAVFDMEHTGWTIETIKMLIATTRSTDVIPMVRIPATQYHFVARVLDMGAMGVMAPMVEDAAQAAALVAAAKYPPVGRRGAAFAIAHDDYSGGDIVEKIQSANFQTFEIAQIETASRLRNVEEIASIEGVDCLWIGHFDLTNSLGIPGQFDHLLFREAVDKVLAACQRHGKAPGFMAADVPTGKKLLDQGFRILAYGGDLWLFQAALAQGLAALKEHRGPAAL
jgi:2-dehydro-3-deoxyglucarate aldolase/4-hydroxy-2-oxoheptanedioate aldolase